MRDLIPRTCLLLIMIFSGVLPAFGQASAGVNPEPELTIQEAAERAYRVSHEVRRAAEEKSKALLEKQKATDALKDSYIFFTPEYEEDHRRVVMAELNYQAKMGAEEAASERLDVRVVEKYAAVLSARGEVEVAGREFAREEWNFSRARVSRRLGAVSAFQLEQARTALQARRSALDLAEKQLAKAYEELNILIGYPAERRPRLVTEFSFQPLDIKSILAEANRALEASHDLYALGRYVQIQRQELRSLFLDRDLQEKEVKLSELDKAELRREIQNQVRLFYQDILALEETINSARIGLQAAENTLRLTRVRQEVGLAVRGDLLGAELEVAAARQRLLELELSHYAFSAAYRNLTGRTVIPPAAEDLS